MTYDLTTFQGRLKEEYRTIDYVKAEISSLSKQLNAMEAAQ